jgi:hypothetical protein
MIIASATQKPAAPRLTNDIGRHIVLAGGNAMLWIILVVIIAVVLYTQRDRLSNLRR